MKKRGIFSLVLLLVLNSIFAADITDLGTAYELVIAENAYAEAETNSSSSVSTITNEEIKAYNAQTTAELVGKAIGVSFNSVGSLGAMQTVVIRGATSSKNQIYLDGVLLSSAHDGSFDLSIIPVDIIDHIEIIKSGSGNLGRTNAIGGMVNIITKKGRQTEKPFSLSIENGSFIPSVSAENYQALLDSQKLDLSYTNKGVVATVGGLIAQNAFTYSSGTAVRKNAQVYQAHGSLNFDASNSDNLTVRSQNLVNYQNLGVPGGLTWGLTPNDHQNNLLVSTNNSIILVDASPMLNKLSLDLDYSYAQTFFHDADYIDSTHNKHKGAMQLQGDWNLDQQISLTTGTSYTLDYVDSTDVGNNTRQTTSAFANGGLYFSDGKLSLYPSLNIAYLSDLKVFSPNASFGTVYAVSDATDLKATVSYAENTPTFSELYWPSMGNPNLKTEKGLNADLGLSTAIGSLTYEGTAFGRNIYNAITYNSSTWLPDNIAHSVYLGTEQTLGMTFSPALSLQASYLYNKSYDLSGGKTFSDNVEVSTIRKHTAKASLFFASGIFDAVLSAEYLGKSNSLNSAVLVNASVNMQVADGFKAYVAVDNLLNTSYELSTGGYPMPGTKVRLGGTLRF